MKLKEKTKLTLGGIWVLMLVIVGVWLLSLFKDTAEYQLVILVWAFAWLGSWQFSSFINWSKEYKDKLK